MTANAGDEDSIPESGRSPGEGNGNPLQYSCLGKSHGQRSLAGYSPWGPKESDTTEHVHATNEFYSRALPNIEHLSFWSHTNSSKEYTKKEYFQTHSVGPV